MNVAADLSAASPSPPPFPTKSAARAMPTLIGAKQPADFGRCVSSQSPCFDVIRFGPRCPPPFASSFVAYRPHISLIVAAVAASAITHEGIYNEHFFEAGEERDEVFRPTAVPAISRVRSSKARGARACGNVVHVRWLA